MPAKENLNRQFNQWIDKFESLFTNSQDIMNLFSLSQRKILRWNPQAAISMGYTREELERLPVEELYPPEELAKLGDTFAILMEKGFSEAKQKIYNSKKELRDIWIRSFVIQYEPEILCLVHTIDITEEKEKERQQLKETRLAALGEASASLAHEINNALQGIQFNLYLLKDEARKALPASGFARLDKIESNLAHIEAVIRNVQNYTHVSESSKAYTFVSSLVDSALQILEGYLDSRQIEVQQELAKNLPPLWINGNQLVQVLLVLIKNAAQAMVNTSSKVLGISSEVVAGELVLRVKDSGCGIPREAHGKLFSSFVTTKRAGVGLGLGLAVAKKLAAVNKVSLSFTSVVGQGTEFSLLFPPSLTASAQALLVLYVDDKESLAESSEEALARHSLLVIKAQTAREALRILSHNRVALLLAGENMYPLSGIDFLREARALHQGPMVLLREEGCGEDEQLQLSQGLEVKVRSYPRSEEAWVKEVLRCIKL